MANNNSPIKRTKRKNLHFYHSPTQMRSDTWNRLEEFAGRLYEKQKRQAGNEALLERTRESITLLETFESYTAFPSQDDFNLLWQLFEQQNYALLSNVVSRIVRALTGGTYRSRRINLRVAAEVEDRGEGAQYHEESGQKRPYFEVLFVDESSPEDARYLRERLRELRRPEDQFVYDIVSVN